MSLLGQFVPPHLADITPVIKYRPYLRARESNDDIPAERFQPLPGGSIQYDSQGYIAARCTHQPSATAMLAPGLEAILPRCGRSCGRVERYARVVEPKVGAGPRQLVEPKPHRAHRWEPYVPPSVRNAPERYWKKERPELVGDIADELEVETMPDLQVVHDKEDVNTTWEQKRSRRKKRPLKHRNKGSNPNQEQTPMSKPVVKGGIKSESELWQS